MAEHRRFNTRENRKREAVGGLKLRRGPPHGQLGRVLPLQMACFFSTGRNDIRHQTRIGQDQVRGASRRSSAARVGGWCCGISAWNSATIASIRADVSWSSCLRSVSTSSRVRGPFRRPAGMRRRLGSSGRGKKAKGKASSGKASRSGDVRVQVEENCPGFVPVGPLHNREQQGILRTDQTGLSLGGKSS
jgi:hypothetical protein